MSKDVPYTLNTLLRSCSDDPPATSASQSLDEDNILEEIEVEEAKKGKEGRANKRKASNNDDMFLVSQLRETMTRNQELLERLLVPAHSEREVFIR